MSPVEIIQADLDNPIHQQAVVEMINAYAQDPMGDGKPLPDQVRRELIPNLRSHPAALVFLAFQDGEPIGLADCTMGFSTFKARPLLNIGDLAVIKGRRGQGTGRLILAAVEAKARELGCCRITLEVQENNRRARHVYGSVGFNRVIYEEEAGQVLFMSKSIL